MNISWLIWILVALVVALLLLLSTVFLKSQASLVQNYNRSGNEVTAADDDDAVSRYGLPQGTHVLDVNDIEGLTGGQVTIHCKLPAGSLAKFLQASPFKSVKLDSGAMAVSPVSGSSWFSVEQEQKIFRRGHHLSGVYNFGSGQDSILIDEWNPDVYDIYIQDVR